VEFKRILAKAHSGKELSLDEIKCLLLAAGSEQAHLFDAASAIREEHFGGTALVRAVVEFSNFCHGNCLYCGMRHENNSLQRYRLSFNEIRQQATEARDLGIGTLFLQSGEDFEYPLDDLCGAITWATIYLEVRNLQSASFRQHEAWANPAKQIEALGMVRGRRV